MKRVMVGALTLALMLGAVGCGEEKNDNAMIIGGADAFGAEEIIVTPQGVPEETTHEYKPGEGKIENLPNTEGQEGKWLDM